MLNGKTTYVPLLRSEQVGQQRREADENPGREVPQALQVLWEKVHAEESETAGR